MQLQEKFQNKANLNAASSRIFNPENCLKAYCKFWFKHKTEFGFSLYPPEQRSKLNVLDSFERLAYVSFTSHTQKD